ncbi:MAG: FAD-dependent oxidoreductase [Leptolinea sp.]
MSSKPTVLIIGAGFTGCALAYDLTLRGFSVTVVERGEICSGTSGRTHGLLHSGGRYCVNDEEAAIECIEENIILRRIARQCMEFNLGMAVAITQEELQFRDNYQAGAEKCGIPVRWMESSEILAREPAINPSVLGGFEIPDGTFDPLRLGLAFAASAKNRGAVFFTYHQVDGIHVDGQSRATNITVINRHTNQRIQLNADVIINATGAWAGKIAALAGVNVPVIPTPGVMVAFNQRLINRPINRLALPGDGDIILPQRRMAVIGTTSFEVEDVDYIPIDAGQVQQMVDRAAEMVPAVRQAGWRGSYMSARPLIQSGTDARSLSRTFKCYDHEADQGLKGFITITGGKATTCRVMAEKTADLVSSKFNISSQCQTSEFVLDSYRTFYFRQPAL